MNVNQTTMILWLTLVIVTHVSITEGQVNQQDYDVLNLTSFSQDRFWLADENGIRWRQWEPQFRQLEYNQNLLAGQIETKLLEQTKTQLQADAEPTLLRKTPRAIATNYRLYDEAIIRISTDETMFAVISMPVYDDWGNLVTQSSGCTILSLEDGASMQHIRIDEHVFDCQFLEDKRLVLVSKNAIWIYAKTDEQKGFAVQHEIPLGRPIESWNKIAIGPQHVAIRHDKEIEVFSLEARRRLRQFSSSNSATRNVISHALSSNGRFLAACFSSRPLNSSGSLRGSEQFVLTVWDVGTGKTVINKYGGHFDNANVRSHLSEPEAVLYWKVCFAPDSTSVIASGFHSGRCVQIAIPDGDILQTFSPWDSTNQNRFSTSRDFRGHRGDFARVAASNNGWNPRRFRSTGERDGQAGRFATDLWNEQLVLMVDGHASFRRLCFVRAGERQPFVEAELGQSMTLVAASNHTLLFRDDWEKGFFKLNLESASQIHDAVIRAKQSRDQHSEAGLSVDFNQNQIAVVGTTQVDGLLVNVNDGRLLRQDFSSQARTFFARDRSFWVQHDSDAGRFRFRRLDGHTNCALSQASQARLVGLSPSGSMLTLQNGQMIDVYETATGSLRQTISNAPGLTGLIPADDGDSVVGFVVNQLYLFNASTETSTWETWDNSGMDRDITNVAIDPSSRVVAVGDDNGIIRVWSLSSKTLLDQLQLAEGFPTLAMSFDQESSQLGILQSGWRLWEWTQPNVLEPLPIKQTLVSTDWDWDGGQSAVIKQDLKCEIQAGSPTAETSQQVTITLRVNNQGNLPANRVSATVLVASKDSPPTTILFGRIPAGETREHQVTIPLQPNERGVWLARCQLQSACDNTTQVIPFKVTK